MEGRQYLQCKITSHDGRTWYNPLMLKEVHLVTALAKENESVKVTIETINQEEFERKFGQ